MNIKKDDKGEYKYTYASAPPPRRELRQGL